MIHSLARPIRWLAMAMALGGGSCMGQLTPSRVYAGLNRPIACEVALPGATPEGSAVEVALIEPGTGRVVERGPLPARQADAPDWTIDLSQAFPVLWTERRPRMLYAQLIVGGQSIGAPIVLEPLMTPARYRDELTERVMEAFRRRDAAELTRLLALSEAAKAEMRQRVREQQSDRQPVFSGLRTYPLRDVVLETSEGTMRIRLEPSAAPRTVFRFLALVDDGFYEQLAFHRIVNADAEGLPFIVQCGDPTGTGFGGDGELSDFEPSTIAHDLGVVSMARRIDDPNSNGPQFFICLGRHACAKLDGRFTSFGRVVDGLDTLSAIAATPVAPVEDGTGESVGERPIHPPVLEHARSIPAAPIALRTPPAKAEEAPIER